MTAAGACPAQLQFLQPRISDGRREAWEEFSRCAWGHWLSMALNIDPDATKGDPNTLKATLLSYPLQVRRKLKGE